MRVGLAALAERVRSSLFVVPVLFVLAGIALGLGGIAFDRHFTSSAQELPLGFTSTVESARAVLGTIAGATITVAGIAFSVSLLILQLASSQYSPRVVTGLFRDPFNKAVIGIVMGTFTYCLVVLRSVRAPLEEQGDPVIPNASVALGVLLGIVAILAIIAFINHNAHAMNISEILAVVTRNAAAAVDHDRVPKELVAPDDAIAVAPAPTMSFTVRCTRDGWVQLVDYEALLELAPAHGALRLETAIGRFVFVDAPLCTVWPKPHDTSALEHKVRAAVRVGKSRTVQQDPSYGLRQLADIALKALSPGVNDPTTAQEAIFHIGAVLRPILESDPAPRALRHEDKVLLLPKRDDPEDLVNLAFDEVRRAAADQPAVCVYLVESMALLSSSLTDTAAARALPLLRAHAEQVVEACRRAEPHPGDLAPVQRSFQHHFAT